MRTICIVRSITVFGLLVLMSGVLSAQEYNFRNLGVAEGLNNLAIRQIYQDQVGFIWVSTENGIFRYDGERFEAFGPEQGIPSTSGAAFGDAPDGSLLVGGDFGLYQLPGRSFRKVLTDVRTVSWAQGIQSDGKGHTFIGTDSGLVELYSESGQHGFAVRRFPQAPGTSGPDAYGVLVDGDILWYGCGEELCRMDRDRTTVFGRESGLPNRALLVIQKDRAGNLWVRAKNAGVFVLPLGQARFRRPDAPIPGSDMGLVATDADGRILIPSPDGLLIRDEKGWQKIDRSAGLRGAVYAAFEDRQHSLWIGLEGRGLTEWPGYREWENYSAASGLASDIVYEILPRADGYLWTATEGGLFRGTRRGFGIVWKKVAGLVGFPVHSLQMAPGGDLWVGTETRGVARLNTRTGSVQWLGQERGLSGIAAYTLRFDREQRLWVATEMGLFVAIAPYVMFSRVTELPSTRIWAIAEGTDGTIWAGGAGGLFGYSSGRWKNWTHRDGLSNQEVLSLGAGADGTMWIGYRHGGGIDRVHPKPGGGIAIEKGVQRPGSDGLVYFLELDASSRLWVGTERGVDRWDGSRWTHYDTSDGLAWDDCNLNAFAEEPDGTVWIGTSGGLSRFKPRPHRAPEPPPKVVFTKLVMGGTDVSGQRDPSLGIHSSSLIAGYSAPNAPRNNGVVFRYRLGGANSNWTETAQRELQFAALAPGAYRLQVEARDSDGVWSGHTAEFPFKILSPWYRTWWFLGMCGLIPLSVGFGVFRLRMLGAQRREHELKRLVEEKTTDLQRVNEDLLRLSSLDPLTGLANRRVFDKTLQMECARVKRTASAVSLLILDLDHFKALNDSQGHQRGDEYLKLVGSELTRLAKRKIDLAARYGGEEFAVILPATDSAGAERIGESVRLAIASLVLPHPASPAAPFLTVSVGVATATTELHRSPEELIAAADHALYEAKRRGRNRVSVADMEAVPLRIANRLALDLA